MILKSKMSHMHIDKALMTSIWGYYPDLQVVLEKKNCMNDKWIPVVSSTHPEELGIAQYLTIL